MNIKLIFGLGLLLLNTVCAQTVTDWQIIIPEKLQHEEAIKIVLSDLNDYSKEVNINFYIDNVDAPIEGHTIIVGNPSINKITSELQKKLTISLKNLNDEQGYEILTTEVNNKKIIVVSGNSVIGNVYGLYWLWDRMRVYKTIPDINIFRIPALKTRMSLAWGRRPFGGGSKETMKQALRQSLNWVSGAPILDLIPWDSEPEKTINEKNRIKTKELINYAHSLGIKYFCFANEFTYHPSILEKFNATLSPCDSNFWSALKHKYRELFTALPELDGIEVCNDDISGFWDNYRGFDILHKGDNCEMPYPKRFQKFVKNLWEVVVEEFDKTYFHFTWGLVAHEQHYSAEVFREIFTDEIPDKNLYLIPKITSGDRWWHQPYNPTFNQSKHNTLIAFETMNYYEGGSSNIFPTFAGQYYQGGIQSFLSPENNNIKGAGFLVNPSKTGWDTFGAYSYVLYRLAWNPNEDIEQIAKDFCAINFGREASEVMSDIYLMTPVAYKYGLHIEPISYGRFNSFIHMRVNVFPAMGYPHIDNGREHMEFLNKVYLRCKPWINETLDDLDHGLDYAISMVEKYKSVKSLITDSNLAQNIENRLKMTRWLIQTNNEYAKTTFKYFKYRENPTRNTKLALSKSLKKLNKTKKSFINTPGFGYKLFGVNQLIKNAEEAIKDLELAENKLSIAPTRDKLERIITKQQDLYKNLLNKYKDVAKKILHVEVKVDGRDLLIVNEDKYEIKNLRWDGAHIQKIKLFNKLPKEEVTVIPLDIKSRPMHPFILEQPNSENDYSVTVYLYDKPGADGIMEFELYYIPEKSEDIGLNIPWK